MNVPKVARRFLLGLGVALSFGIGYGATTKAWPGVADRAAGYGYFQNKYDPNGQDVLLGGIHSGNANQFINDVLAQLNGPCCRQRTGAEFIIHTMIGSPPNQRNRPPTPAQIDDWERRVRFAEVMGRVNWNMILNYTVNSYYQDAWNDAAYFYGSGASDSIVFFNPDGTVAYALRRPCANPLGDTNGLPPAPPDFHFDGESFIDGLDRSNPTSPFITGQKNLLVWPGDTVNFFHFVWNWGTGGGSTRYQAWQHPRVTTPFPSPQWQSAPNMQGPPFLPNPGNIFLNPGNNVNVNWNSFTIPANAQVGDTFCQHIGFFWTAWDAPYATDKLDKQACAQVTYSYNLIPIASVDKSTAIQGDQVTFSYSVQNQGPTNSRPANWGTNIRTVTPTTVPQPLPAQDNIPYRLPFDQSSNFVPVTYTPGTHPLNDGSAGGVMTKTVTVSGQPGDKICASAGIDPGSMTVGSRYSAEACVVIAKSPYVQFLGNDVWAGGGFPDVNPACNTSAKITTSSHTLGDGTIAGSVGEYGVFALGKITNFGSASKAIVNPAGAVGKMLTFSNINSGNLGFYGAPQHCINSYIATYSGTPITSEPVTMDVGGRPSGTWQVNGAHTFHGTMPNGSQQIYLVNGDVTIDNDLKYSDNYNSTADIPSLVIIATGNILVQDNVGQMDGLFIAKNTLNTCGNAPSGNLSVNICNKQLTVNGAAIVGSLTLLRTYGADGNNDTDRKRPAEVFNFNPEMYLRSALNSGNTNTVQVIDEKDLPPRY